MPKPFVRLVLDTATKYLYLALIQNDKVVAESFVEGTGDHSVRLMPAMETMLRTHQLEVKELDELYIGIGPGSYTGVRIGVSIAKMLGYLNGTKTFAFSSLALMATASEKPLVISLIDARRKNAFMASFGNQNGKFNRLGPDVLEPISEYLSSHSPESDIVSEGQKPNVLKLLINGHFESVQDIHALVPNYLQITEAEKNRRHENAV
jgi:tRNA threonylcarbamoyladenosine biosynthesis protein TsaB